MTTVDRPQTKRELPDILRQHPYFAILDLAFLVDLAQKAIYRTFAPGETIFLEGEHPSSGMWIVGKGRVKIYRTNADGSEYILHIIGEGQSFNDVSAFDGGSNPASSAALASVAAWVFLPEVLETAIHSNPAMAISVVKGISHRMRFLVEQIDGLALCSTTTRLSRFLLEQAKTPTLRGPGVTRVTIASYLGTTPETVSRGLRQLEKVGAVQADRTQVTILRHDLLRAIADR